MFNEGRFSAELCRMVFYTVDDTDKLPVRSSAHAASKRLVGVESSFSHFVTNHTHQVWLLNFCLRL